MRIGRSIPPAAAPISFADLAAGIGGLCRGGWEIERFREEVQDYFGIRHCFFLSSGKAALTVILQSLKELFPERDEVIIPAYTCYSVPAAVIRAGLKIVLCDIDGRNLGVDGEKLALLMEKRRPLCVVPTHLYGVPCAMDRIVPAARHCGTIVVEDAAQAMGSQVDGRKLGGCGDVGFFSLGRGKALSTVEGGVIVTSRDDIAGILRRRIETLPPHGPTEQASLLLKGLALYLLLRPTLFWLPKGMPFLELGKTTYDPAFPLNSLSPFQAGLSVGWHSRIASFQAVRRELVERWQALTDRVPWLEKLTGQNPSADLIRFPASIADGELRARVLLESERRGLGIMGGYPASVNRIGPIAHLFSGKEYPAAEKAARELVTFPVHPLMASRDVANIEKFVKEW